MSKTKVIAGAVITLVAIMAVLVATGTFSSDDPEQPLSFKQRVAYLTEWPGENDLVLPCNSRSEDLVMVRKLHSRRDGLRRQLESKTLGSLSQHQYRSLLRLERRLAAYRKHLHGTDRLYNKEVTGYLRAGWNRKQFAAAGLPLHLTPGHAVTCPAW